MVPGNHVLMGPWPNIFSPAANSCRRPLLADFFISAETVQFDSGFAIKSSRGECGPWSRNSDSVLLRDGESLLCVLVIRTEASGRRALY